MTFTSAYVPKYSTSFSKDINKLTPKNRNFVVLGDFNAKHVGWNCLSNNRAGNVLFNMLHKSDFIMHHPQTYTHFPHCGSTPSVIDYALTNSPVIFSNVYTIDGALPSDHSPVIFHIEGTPSETMPNARPNFKKTDWNKYANIVESQLKASESPMSSKSEIDIQIIKFINAIRIAESESVPKEIPRNRKSKISQDTIELIKLRNETQRQWQRCNDEDLKQILKSLVNSQNKRIKSMVRKDFNIRWNKTLSNVKPGDSKLWNLSKKMMNNASNKIEALKVNDQTVTTDGKIAEALADQFVKNHSLTINFKHSVDNEVNRVVKSIDSTEPSTLQNNSNHTSVEEIVKIISKLKIRKAPGLDGIPNILIKRLPKAAIIYLTKIINACIDLCYFPSHFKIEKIISILKPTKDPKYAASYRPISLLSSVGKILERVINTKLSDFLTENSCISTKQFGFRPEHSTVHQIKRIMKIVTENKARRQSTGMVLLDIEKAFDSIWHDGIIFKLNKIGTPTYIVKLIASFLKERSFSVCVNGEQSSRRPIPAGLPQGSIISPLLYAVYTSDLKIPAKCDAGYYADDTAILSAAKQSNTIVKNMTAALSQIHKYFSKWRIKINSEKTQAMLFKFNQSRKRIPTAQLTFNGSIINWNTEATYLGAKLDHKRNFAEHINTSKTKALNSFKALYPLLCKRSHLTIRNKVILYKAIIRPKITYAAPVWINASMSNIHKLQVTQNKILKCIHNVPRSFPTRALHEISEIDMLDDTIHKQANDFLRKCAISDYEQIRCLAT